MGQQAVHSLALGSIYALLAVGLTLISRAQRSLCLAYGGLYALGAYIAWWAVRSTLAVWTAFSVAAFLCAGLGCLLHWWWQHQRARNNTFSTLLASLGLLICSQEAYRFGIRPYSMKVIAVDSHQIYRLGPLMLTDMHWLVFGCAFGLLTALHGVLTTSQLGRASVRALEAEPICGSLVTPSGERLRLWVSGLGAALAGIGGVLSGLYVNDVYPAMGTHLMPTLLALVLLGGLGNWRGALLMAFGMALLEGLWMPATHLVLPAKVFLLIALALGSLRPSGRDTESR